MGDGGARAMRYASALLTVVLALTGGAMRAGAHAAPPVPAAADDVAEPVPPVPVRLDIPAIGVHTGIVRLTPRPDGTMDLPAPGGDAPAGWYGDSPSPGEPGTALLAGHVDPARDRPAVFHRLGELRRGDPIAVRRADGSRVVFEVTEVRVYPGSGFPGTGPADRPHLALVSRGGDFDRERRKHRSNLLVLARLAGRQL